MAQEITIGTEVKSRSPQKRVRGWLAESLGVSAEKKTEIYPQISRSTSLNDLSYWSQVFFSAGIATLGLALNSPAVFIGAMLISPLMGPILASGPALAAGDVVLAARATANLSREIDEDGRLLLIDEVRKRFENAEARVSFQRIQASLASLSFRRNQTQIEARHAEVLD